MTKDNLLTISSQLQSGEITPIDLYARYKKVIDEKDDKIMAFREINPNWEAEAREATKRWKNNKAKSAFDGIPIAIKDNISSLETKTCASSRMLENYIAPYNATVIGKLREVGIIIAGKTNMDEFAMGGSTETSYFGQTSNPHDLKKVPGGSSGGSAASVAAEMVPVALGSDTGGSIRQPASYCGVTGFKPSYGAVSRFGLLAMASSLDQIGPLGKTVEDVREIFTLICGKDKYDSTSRVIDNMPEQKTKHMLVYDPSITESGLDGATKSAMEQTIKILKNNPLYDLKEIKLPYLKEALATYYIIMPAEVSSNMARFDGLRFGYHSDANNYIDAFIESRSKGFGDEVKRRILIGTYVLSAGYSDAYYRKAMSVRRAMIKEYKNILKNADAIILPTSPSTAFEKGTKLDNPIEMYLMDIYTVIANLTTLPAISLPYLKQEQMPVGIQLIGQWGKDYTLLNLAEKFEKEIING